MKERSMKKVFVGFLLVGLSLPGMSLWLCKPTLAQTQAQPPEQSELERLLNQAAQNLQQGQYQRAVSIWQKALLIAKQSNLKEIEATILINIGDVYSSISQLPKALEHYTQALPITRKVKDRIGEARTLTSIGQVYSSIGQQQKALESFTQALPITKEVKDRIGEARTLTSIAWVYSSIGQQQKALEYCTQALPITREVKDRVGEVRTLTSIGLIYSSTGQQQKALEQYTQALPITREIKDRIGEARTLTSIGWVYSGIGQRQKALEYYNQALPITREIKDRIGEARTLTSIGQVYSSIGQRQKALEYYNRALPILREVKDRVGEVRTLTSIGSAYSSIGQPQKALEYYNQTLPITREIEDRIGETETLTSIGWVYIGIDQRQKALEYYNQALAISKEINNRNGEATTLIQIGIAYSHINPQKELGYYTQALPIFREVNNRSGEATTLTNIGEVYSDIGQQQKALEYHNQALPILREVKDRSGEALTLTSIGWVYNSIGQQQKALKYYNQALPILREVKDRSRDATILGSLAFIERSRGNLQAALTHIEDAIKVIETTRTEIVSQEFRTSYFASQQGSYALYIDILMQLHKKQLSQGYDAKALQVSERARARSLIDLLNESQTDIRQGVDPKLLEQEKNLQFQFNSLEKRRIEFYSKSPTQGQTANSKPKYDTPIAGKPNFEQEYNTLSTQYQDLQAQIRANSPRYAALTQPKPLTLAELQQQVLDNNTVLIEYFLGKDRSYLWAVTSSGITSYELPKQTDIEAAAQRFQTVVSNPNAQPPEIAKAGTPLTQMLLGPVAKQLGQKRLVIVSNGALQYLPFAALPAPSGSKYLLMEHEIVTLPSASTLATLRKEISGRKPATKGVAVFADPVFSATDPRVTQGPSSTEKKTAQTGSIPDPFSVQTLRDASEEAGINFERLPGTRQEAQDILKLLPANTRTQALDFEANKSNVLNSNLSQYRIIHFATHGILNTNHPELSAVVLSLVDRQGRKENGFLRLNDIFNLNLPSELVVLSACETGRGQNISGEGLIGLTRGFMYAGTPRVVASLWQVNDESTAVLMTRFYKAMLEKGLPPAAALRAAQLELQKQPQWQSPHYWAAFTLQGEWQ
jgi:CHAT domain-containing protein/Tfp pilus assembly protein PilF